MSDEILHSQEDEGPPLPLDALVERLYSRLKGLAARVQWRGPEATRPTSLLHAAYLKLRTSGNLGPKTESEIIGIFAHVMRQIMVDAARKARSRKRGGGMLVTPLENHEDARESVAPQTIAPEDVLAVNRALTDLDKQSARQARVFEYKYYLGMTVPEIASVFGVSVATIERNWRDGKKFLSERLGGGA